MSDVTSTLNAPRKPRPDFLPGDTGLMGTPPRKMVLLSLSWNGCRWIYKWVTAGRNARIATADVMIGDRA